MSWAYKGTITITGSSTLLPSTQTNFPVLVKLDSVNCTVGGVNRIKATANGGAVQNTGSQSGGNAVTMPFDLVFYSDSGLTTKIPWEVESYDGTGGTLWAWVLMASCALSGNLYFGLGDAAVNTQQNTAGNAPSAVWDANFKGVWHLPDGSSLFVADSTSIASTTTNHSATATTGQIDGGAAFNGSTQYIDAADSVSLRPTSITISAWVNPAATTAFSAAVSKNSQSAGDFAYKLDINASNKFRGYVFNNGGATLCAASDSAAITTGIWYFLAFTYDSAGATGKLYKNNGAAISTTAGSGAISYGTATDSMGIAAGIRGVAQPSWNGSLDEIRISNSVRSADWIMAEYQSGLAPQTFAAVSLVSNTTGTLFRPSTLSGLGSGGPFFQNPLG